MIGIYVRVMILNDKKSEGKEMTETRIDDMKTTTVITTIVCLLPVIAGIILYRRLPDTMVTHWDFKGNPNGWSPKFVAAIVLPGALAIINILFPFLFRLDPKYENLNVKVREVIQWIIPVTSIFCSVSTLMAGLGYNNKINVTGPLFIGLIFIVVGNYLPKTKRSYTVGIKVPWTLESDENWNKTHRMAGFLWVIGGIIIMASTFIKNNMCAMITVIVVLTFAPIVYSYLIYRKKNENSDK